jgi:hypothetical protein
MAAAGLSVPAEWLVTHASLSGAAWAESTHRTYASALAHFLRFVSTLVGAPLLSLQDLVAYEEAYPARLPIQLLQLFTSYLAGPRELAGVGLAPSTVGTYVSGVITSLRVCGLDRLAPINNPLWDRQLSLLRKGVLSEYSHRIHSSAPMPARVLIALASSVAQVWPSCSPLLEAALSSALLLQFFTCSRISEIVWCPVTQRGLRLGDVVRLLPDLTSFADRSVATDGASWEHAGPWLIFIDRSKTDQAAAGRSKPVPCFGSELSSCPASALRRYLRLRISSSGSPWLPQSPLLVSDQGAPLSSSLVNAYIRAALTDASGAVPPYLRDMASSHAIRRGAASALSNAPNVSQAVLCALGAWSDSSAPTQHYVFPSVASIVAAQTLMLSDEAPTLAIRPPAPGARPRSRRAPPP